MPKLKTKAETAKIRESLFTTPDYKKKAKI